MNNNIPGFKGEICFSGGSDYETARQQYATSSYPTKDMSPYMIAFPKDEADISLGIQFAKDQGKKIVARSGGHQYTGKSSGGDDTVVFDMEYFSDRSIEVVDGKKFATVGPGLRLEKIAAFFKDNHVTIPHGECPKVAIGGHAQTGGYGHLARSFGLALDWVRSFDIILADGKKRTITHPTLYNNAGSEIDEQLNRDIFWAVLGGNAGSFGIVTQYTFECIQDEDHPNSYGYTCTRLYDKNVYKNLMKCVQDWSQRIDNDTLPPGLDFMMTVASDAFSSIFDRFAVSLLLVELVYADIKNKDGSDVDYMAEFQPIKYAAGSDMSGTDKFLDTVSNIADLLGADDQFGEVDAKKSLSELSYSFVRKPPISITEDGREFKYPYKKRVNCTVNALSDTFIDKFANMIDKVVDQETGSGVHLVFQMVFGGSKYKENGDLGYTSIPHRDLNFQFVFDLFYERGCEKKAIDFQDEMQKIVEDHFNSDGQEQRMFWGTFNTQGQGVIGSANDIRDPAVRKMFYDSEDQYKRLQEIKKQVDPTDIFSTELTVKLPGTPDRC